MAHPWHIRLQQSLQQSLLTLCPHCGAEFPLTKGLTEQLREHLLAEERGRFDTERARLQRMVAEEREAIETERKTLRKQLREEARKDAQADAQTTIADLQQNVDANKKKLAAAQQAELGLRAENRRLNDRVAEQELENARTADAARKEARNEAERVSAVKIRASEDRIEQLTREIDKLKQKADAPSRLGEGVPNQKVFGETLKLGFPDDIIEVIRRGQAGVDVNQTVQTPNRQRVGLMSWENKHAMQWKDEWIEKHRKDMRVKGSDLGIIVNNALPPSVEGCALIDGVWVCDYKTAPSLAAVLRFALLWVWGYRTANALREDAAGRIFDFLATGAFASRVVELLRGFRRMEEDLSKEKIAVTRMWGTREAELARAKGAIAAIIGELIGKGAELSPEVHDQFALPGNASDVELAVPGNAPVVELPSGGLARTCQKCGDQFRHLARPGRPPLLCPACREPGNPRSA
jgi:hypothetical protein